MPGYVIHIATAQEYLKKHNKKISHEFIKGTIEPDFASDKSKTHYGKSPAYTNLKSYLDANCLDSEFSEGFFLHLVTDYLFYNYYLERIEKPQIYNDYDFTNKKLIEEYNVELPEQVKDKVFFKDGETKILSLELAKKVINEVSSLDLKEIEKEIKKNNIKWNTYKNIV